MTVQAGSHFRRNQAACLMSRGDSDSMTDESGDNELLAKRNEHVRQNTDPVKWPEPSPEEQARDAKADALAKETGLDAEGDRGPEWLACWLFIASGRDFRNAFLTFADHLRCADDLYRMQCARALLTFRPKCAAAPWPSMPEEEIQRLQAMIDSIRARTKDEPGAQG